MFTIPLVSEKKDILHIDADAFFASVEQAINPSLKGKAIVVGWSDNNFKGIVSAASYEAKSFGIYSGMPMYQALQRCPHATVVKSNFQAYKDFSGTMNKIFHKYTDLVEMWSIDEAFLDISQQVISKSCSPKDYAIAILEEIFKTLDISISCGLASNKTVAKVASSTYKPRKITVVPFGKERDFLAPLSLNALPGIGRKTFELLSRYGLTNLGDLSSLSSEEVISRFGPEMVSFWKKAMGFGSTNVVSERDLPKSISKEQTFYYSETFHQAHLETLEEMLIRLTDKLKKKDLKAKIVTLKVRYKFRNPDNEKEYFLDRNFSQDLGYQTFNLAHISQIIKKLLNSNLDPQKPIRLLGVCLSGLIQNYNLQLFPEAS